MKKLLQSLVLLLIALMVPTTATAAYEQLADGVYQDGSTLYISSSVTSLGDLQVNPSEIYCYATIPPACKSNTFTGYDATLHVPAAGMVSYFTTLYWYNFNNILSDAIEPLSVTINTADAELEIGQQLSLSATVDPGDATPKTVYWSSTDASVATVSGCGTVTALATGECDILATCVDKVAVCHITVVNPLVTITLNQHEARLLPNHTITLTATCSPIDVELVVTSSNPGVAIPRLVNGAIMVVGVSEGTTTITVNAADGNGNPDSCEVTIYTEPGDVNCDGYVNISDVTKLIDYLLSDNPEGLSVDNADTNSDGKVNIGDVTALIDYLLSDRWPWQHDMTFTVNGVSFKMIYVDCGTFTMGASEDDTEAWGSEKPAHQVTLSSFRIGQTEVTQALWLAVMGSNPSSHTGNLNFPVENVSWKDCQTFIAKLNEITGEQFRLPTEAEWEFAARGGNNSQGYKYAGSNDIDDVAWYSGNSGYSGSSLKYSHRVCTKAANELGLYDMSGNVWEWCQDWDGSYSNDPQTNPGGPEAGRTRINRGGCYVGEAADCRVSSRSGYDPAYSLGFLGLRLALGPDNSTTPDEHEYVDLGLPSGTLWATMNVGASSPEGCGDYFSWGETETKERYIWSSYGWSDGTYNTMRKYCTDSSYGTIDNKTELEPEDDAAYMNWGARWQMPSYDQLQELCNMCSWQTTYVNGMYGYIVTGPNGNTLFLPTSGSAANGVGNIGLYGYYWSRTLVSDGPYTAYGLRIGQDNVAIENTSRCSGLSVRAVRVVRDTTADFSIEPQSIDFGLVPVGEVRTGVLNIVNNTIEDLTLTATLEEPFSFKQGGDATSSMTIEVPGQSSLLLTVMFNGTTLGQFNGNAIIQKSTLDGYRIVVPVHVLAYASPDAQQEYADLGLPSGTLWATMNIGANSPEEYGDYFAWGETAPDDSYSWSTYRWSYGNTSQLTKYCTLDGCGTFDNLAALQNADDAAYVNWGSDWRMPTVNQLKELRTDCTWHQTAMNGVSGYLIIGNNFNTIFLPATGLMNGSSLNNAGSDGYFWSRELVSLQPYNAYYTYFNSDGVHAGYGNRYIGMAVRAVHR